MDKKDILNDIDHRDGRTVPDGYFADFTAKMQAMLPEQEWERESREPVILKPRTTWQKIRPYVYMAAMFAGIWLMMNMFTLFGPASADERLAANDVLVAALNDSTFIEEQEEDLDDAAEDVEEVMDLLYAEGVTAADLRRAAFSEDNM